MNQKDGAKSALCTGYKGTFFPRLSEILRKNIKLYRCLKNPMGGLSGQITLPMGSVSKKSPYENRSFYIF
ncbi:hypothetical protein FM107_04880 [Sphingobacterium sp. JB170]|nr:hypothetical protein FM107_04880 [Sphingobacterium sp. JB170]